MNPTAIFRSCAESKNRATDSRGTFPAPATSARMCIAASRRTTIEHFNDALSNLTTPVRVEGCAAAGLCYIIYASSIGRAWALAVTTCN